MEILRIKWYEWPVWKKSYAWKMTFRNQNTVFNEKVETTIEYGQNKSANDSLSEISSTSVPGGNRVDGLPPASSHMKIGWNRKVGLYDLSEISSSPQISIFRFF